MLCNLVCVQKNRLVGWWIIVQSCLCLSTLLASDFIRIACSNLGPKLGSSQHGNTSNKAEDLFPVFQLIFLKGNTKHDLPSQTDPQSDLVMSTKRTHFLFLFNSKISSRLKAAPINMFYNIGSNDYVQCKRSHSWTLMMNQRELLHNNAVSLSSMKIFLASFSSLFFFSSMQTTLLSTWFQEAAGSYFVHFQPSTEQQTDKAGHYWT